MRRDTALLPAFVDDGAYFSIFGTNMAIVARIM